MLLKKNIYFVLTYRIYYNLLIFIEIQIYNSLHRAKFMLKFLHSTVKCFKFYYIFLHRKIVNFLMF